MKSQVVKRSVVIGGRNRGRVQVFSGQENA